MHAHNNRAARSVARLGLESLESRTLLSATLPTLAPLAGPAALQQSAANMQVQSMQTTQPAAAAHYSYAWSLTPGAVITGTNSTTGNGMSTGCVMVALYRGGNATTLDGSSTGLHAAVVSSSSSATMAEPDQYNSPVSIHLKIKDNDSGASTYLSFNGTLKGTMNAWTSSLTLTMKGPLTLHAQLGKHVYTVTLNPGKNGTLAIPDPSSGKLSPIDAIIGVSKAPVAHNA